MKDVIVKNPPVSEYMHYWIMRKLKEYGVKTIVDMGGTGKFNKWFNVTCANKKKGIDGTCLPYEDKLFDASTSVATLEHVDNQMKFLEEAVRVAKKVSIHWFPYGIEGDNIEKFKTLLGHKHPCRIIMEDELVKFLKSKKLKYTIVPMVTYREHLLALATLYPKLNVERLYEYLYDNDGWIGILLTIEI